METSEKLFQFDEANHIYTLDGKPLHGITTVLSESLPKPFTWWASGMALKPLGWHNPKDMKKAERIENVASYKKMLTELDDAGYEELLQKCYRNHNDYKKSRAKDGTDVHKAVETWANACIASDTLFKPEDERLHDFYEWCVQNEVKFIQSEKMMYSEKHWIAGTCDLILEVNGKKMVGDIKTSKAIRPSYFVQMGGYQIMLEEMGEEFEGRVCILIPHEGKFDVQFSYDGDRDKGMFLAALTIFKGFRTWKK